jgi:tryptophan-rich sensory protein
MLALTDPRTAHFSARPRPGPVGVAVIAGACAAALAVGGLVSAPVIGWWFAGVHKPDWAPPEWVFGPVWTALSALTAVAASMVWLSRARDVCCPLTACAVQLLLGVVWCVCFFGLQSPLLGFLDVCLLWVVGAVTTAEFFLVSRTAGWLLVPHWLWVTYVAALNGAILVLGG